MAFCPNCGKPATDAATRCIECGQVLKSASTTAGRFKGTMLMTGSSPVDPQETGNIPQKPVAPPPAANEQPPPNQSPVSPQQPGHANMAFQATMLNATPQLVQQPTGPEIQQPQAMAPQIQGSVPNTPVESASVDQGQRPEAPNPVTASPLSVGTPQANNHFDSIPVTVPTKKQSGVLWAVVGLVAVGIILYVAMKLF